MQQVDIAAHEQIPVIHITCNSMSKSEAPPPTPHPTGSFEPGEAKYFHRRTGIMKKLKESMSPAEEDNSGTATLIQAAPGAGKSALLTELCKAGTGAGAEVDSGQY